MITFDVVKEEHGWAVRMGKRMTTPFRSREQAIREANWPVPSAAMVSARK